MSHEQLAPNERLAKVAAAFADHYRATGSIQGSVDVLGDQIIEVIDVLRTPKIRFVKEVRSRLGGLDIIDNSFNVAVEKFRERSRRDPQLCSAGSDAEAAKITAAEVTVIRRIVASYMGVGRWLEQAITAAGWAAAPVAYWWYFAGKFAEMRALGIEDAVHFNEMMGLTLTAGSCLCCVIAGRKAWLRWRDDGSGSALCASDLAALAAACRPETLSRIRTAAEGDLGVVRAKHLAPFVPSGDAGGLAPGGTHILGTA